MTTTDPDQARADALEAFLSRVNKSRPGSFMTLGGGVTGADIDIVSTGVPALDVALGAGGFPRGRIIELYGPEGSGKTSLALSVVAEAQRQGLVAGFIDAEHALNRDLAIAMGVDPNRFVIAQPSDGEEAITLCEEMAKSGAFGVIIVDSVAALVPRAELDGEVGDQQMGLHARLMGKFMRRIAGPLAESNTMLILVNQIRVQLSSYGSPEASTGGKSIKFAASVRLEVRSAASKRIERNGKIVGQTCVVKVTKNKTAAPFGTCEYDLYFGEGIDGLGSLLTAAEARGIVVRAGASFTEAATGEKLGVGRDAVKTRIREDAELAERLKAALFN